MISAALARHRLAGRMGGALVALFAFALLAGCGGGSSSTGTTDTVVVTSGGARTTNSTQSPSSTTHTAQTTQTTSTAGKIPTTASTTPAPSGSVPSPTKAASTAPSGRLLRRYAGNGNTQLGTVVVRTPSTLAWKAQHPPIQIFTAKGFILVNSTAPSGVTRLSRGTYRGMRVASHAGWSVELRTSTP